MIAGYSGYTIHLETINQQNSPSQDYMIRDIGDDIQIYQMNIEGINKSKCQYLMQILLANKTALALI